MKTSTYFFTFGLSTAGLATAASGLSTAGLATASFSDMCGPGTNCMLVQRGNRTGYDFIPGMEPGSADYNRRFGKRQTGPKPDKDGIQTFVTLGGMKVDYGCDASVRKTLEGVSEVCGTAASCDSSAEWTRKVSWTDGSTPRDTDIKVTAKGKYFPDERQYFLDAVVATAMDETIDHKDVEWEGRARKRQVVPIGGTCKMSQFSNFVAITRFEDKNLKSWIEVTIELEENDGLCKFLAGAGGAIAGALSGIAGGYFGAVGALCDTTEL